MPVRTAEFAYQMGFLFDRKITSYYRNTYKGIMGQVQVQVLNHLYENASVKPQEIADQMDIPKQHASKILSRLETLGYVRCSVDPEDRRARLFTLTDSGRELIREHIAASNAHFEEQLERLTETERRQMADAMETMVTILKRL